MKPLEPLFPIQSYLFRLGTFCLVTALCLNPSPLLGEALKALRFRVSSSVWPEGSRFSPEQAAQSLMGTSPWEPQSTLDGSPLPEKPPKGPPWFASRETDLRPFGWGQSSFRVETPWTTVRFMGERPAGAGFTGPTLDALQLSALGTPHDTLAVTNTAATVQEMMEGFFAPLLEDFPAEWDLNPQGKIHIEGFVYSPEHPFVSGHPERYDNAFIFGTNILTIFPSSCHANPNGPFCQAPFLSTGHDPSVVAHEVSHVIFNFLRRGRAMEGIQWNATNEGTADFFSAAWLEEPTLGRIWKSGRPTAPWLRVIPSTPHTLTQEQAHWVYALGNVWSGVLWRLRQKIQSTSPQLLPRYYQAVLLSIRNLGASTGPRLSDSRAALALALEDRGMGDWVSGLQEEARVAGLTEMGFAATPLPRSGRDISPSEAAPQSSCGAVSSGKTQPSQVWLLFVLLCSPFVLQMMGRRPTGPQGTAPQVPPKAGI